MTPLGSMTKPEPMLYILPCGVAISVSTSTTAGSKTSSWSARLAGTSAAAAGAGGAASSIAATKMPQRPRMRIRLFPFEPLDRHHVVEPRHLDMRASVGVLAEHVAE